MERAKLAYVESGGNYILSKAEEKTADFDGNIDAIYKISFSIDEWVELVRICRIELNRYAVAD